MTERPRYKSHLMRRLLEDVEGLDGLFQDLAASDDDPAAHPERPRHPHGGRLR